MSKKKPGFPSEWRFELTGKTGFRGGVCTSSMANDMRLRPNARRERRFENLQDATCENTAGGRLMSQLITILKSAVEIWMVPLLL